MIGKIAELGKVDKTRNPLDVRRRRCRRRRPSRPSSSSGAVGLVVDPERAFQRKLLPEREMSETLLNLVFIFNRTFDTS